MDLNIFALNMLNVMDTPNSQRTQDDSLVVSQQKLVSMNILLVFSVPCIDCLLRKEMDCTGYFLRLLLKVMQTFKSVYLLIKL